MTYEYWAGLFDGEGNIYIAKDLVHLCVSITQKENAILYVAKQKFGGTVVKYGKQTCYKWRVFSIREMISFLEAIEPYVFIKSGEVKIALEFLRGMRMENKGCNPLTSEELVRRKELYYNFALERQKQN